MKKPLSLLSFLILSTTLLFSKGSSQSMVFDGIALKSEMIFIHGTHHHGRAITSSFDFIDLNGKHFEPTAIRDTFSVSLTAYGIHIGDSIHIKLFDERSDLQILNWKDFVKEQKLVNDTIFSSDARHLTYVTSEEQGKFHFILEQFRWNKWVTMYCFPNKEKAHQNTYFIDLSTYLTSGENQFRVVAFYFTDVTVRSSAVRLMSGTPQVLEKQNGDTISFTRKTNFEIYSEEGVMLDHGYTNMIIVADLPKAGYFLCYDNMIIEFFKK